eukprot:m.236373 g.236373  ORF g.236373 m.236373 type:complete len:67 (-) comp15780_c1_seq1:90-290(-)
MPRSAAAARNPPTGVPACAWCFTIASPCDTEHKRSEWCQIIVTCLVLRREGASGTDLEFKEVLAAG